MSINEITSAGPAPALEAMLRFAAQRHKVIAHNVANISTPDFQNKDVSVAGFQQSLREAIERRRGSIGTNGPLQLESTDEVFVGPRGELTLNPTTSQGGVLFHDRNNRDLERLMQGLVENATTFRVASDLLRVHHEQIRSAIAERA